MHSNNNTFISFDERSHVKNWHPPGGVHRATFKSTFKDDSGRQILAFQITSTIEPEDNYWARHGYRDEDMPKLFRQLKQWFGAEEYNKFRREGGCDLEKYYEKEADILVGLINTGKPEPLRVIEDIAPPGTYQADVARIEVGEFEI
jgi:hypothetical protein